MMAIVNQYPAIDVGRQYKYFFIKRSLSDNVLAFFLQFIALMSSTLLPAPNPIWFAPGLAVAMIFLRGYRVLPGIWLGGFFALSFSGASVLTLQAVLLVWITQRFINPSLVFYRANKFLMFGLCNAILAILTSFVLLWIRHFPYSLWLQWSLAIFNGVLIVGIAWVTLDTFSRYAGKSFDSHLAWRRATRSTLVIALFLNMLSFSGLMRFNLHSMIILQMILALGTASYFCISIKK